MDLENIKQILQAKNAALLAVTVNCIEHPKSRKLGDGRCFSCYQRAWIDRRNWIRATPSASEILLSEKVAKKEERRLRVARLHREWRANHPEEARAQDAVRSKTPRRVKQHRDLVLRKKYGLTRARYDQILSEQGGKCAICRSDNAGARRSGRLTDWHVDHCHASGKIRGLLCSKCNTGIGLLGDDVKLLEAAIGYLKRSSL